MDLQLIEAKRNFWIELNDLGNLDDGAWCVGGDFDEVLNQGLGTAVLDLPFRWPNFILGFPNLP